MTDRYQFMGASSTPSRDRHSIFRSLKVDDDDNISFYDDRVVTVSRQLITSENDLNCTRSKLEYFMEVEPFILPVFHAYL